MSDEKQCLMCQHEAHEGLCRVIVGRFYPLSCQCGHPEVTQTVSSAPERPKMMTPIMLYEDSASGAVPTREVLVEGLPTGEWCSLKERPEVTQTVSSAPDKCPSCKHEAHEGACSIRMAHYDGGTRPCPCIQTEPSLRGDPDSDVYDSFIEQTQQPEVMQTAPTPEAKHSPFPWWYDSYNTIFSGSTKAGNLRIVCQIPDHPTDDGPYEPHQAADRGAWYKESEANAFLIVRQAEEIAQLREQLARLWEIGHK